MPSLIVVIAGPIILGLAIGEFASILEKVSQKERKMNEEFDYLVNSMRALHISDPIQNRCLQYYESLKGVQTIR